MFISTYLFLLFNLVSAEAITLPVSSIFVILINFSIAIYYRFKMPILIRRNYLFFSFIAYIIFHSLVFSFSPVISLLKLFSFFCGLSVLNVIYSTRKTWSYTIFIHRVILLIIIGSLIFASFPVGYTKNGVDLNGIFDNPQALGLILVLIFYKIMKTGVKNRNQRIVSVVVLGLIWLTNSRTALFGAIITYVLFKRRSVRALVVFAGLFVLTIVSSPDWLIKKIQKGKSNNVTEIYADSRGALVSDMQSNIQLTPVGIGWGTPSDLDESKVRYIFGVPYSWSAEKGNILFAVWEETGVVGLLFFIALALSILIRLYNLNNGTFELALVVFSLNLSECFLFSYSGIGGLFMLLLTLIARENENSYISL